MIAERFQAATEGAVDEARAVLSSGGHATLQFDEPGYSRALLKSINSLCVEFGERVEVRFYGHDGSGFDFRTLEAIPDVVDLATDCLWRATNFEALAGLTKLRKLSFGVRECDRKDLLSLLDPGEIQTLRLGENAKRNFDLGRLAEFEALETLLVEGHTKGIESIGRLPSLKRLRLRCISKKQRLDFVSTIPKLKSLEIVLGGRDDISEIVSPSLEELEITRVRGFARFPDLADLPALRSLQIEDQPRLAEVTIPSGSTSRLARLVINCSKKLSKIEGLAHLRELDHLRFFEIGLDLESLIEDGLPESLRVFCFYTGNAREEAKARARLDELGYVESE